MLNENFNKLDNEELTNVEGGSIGVAIFIGACVVAGGIGIYNGYCEAGKK